MEARFHLVNFLVYSLLGAKSKWHGYIQSLPDDIVDIIVLWPRLAYDLDVAIALNMMKGTELERECESGDVFVRNSLPFIFDSR